MDDIYKIGGSLHNLKLHADKIIAGVKDGIMSDADLKIVNIYLDSLKSSRKRRSIHKVQRVRKQRFKA
jgi:hypothetical protein